MHGRKHATSTLLGCFGRDARPTLAFAILPVCSHLNDTALAFERDNLGDATLNGLLNDRILMGKPMVISTNLNVEEMSRRYSPQIASRLHGGFQRLTFLGEDIRVLKNRGY